MNAPGDEELERQLLEEMQQLQVLSNSDTKPKESPANADSIANQSSSLADTMKEGLEKVLIADFFFVLFSLGWLGTGLVTKSAFGSAVSCR